MAADPPNVPGHMVVCRAYGLHVIIWPESASQQEQRELYAFNLDEETLTSRFIEPYESGEPVICPGGTLEGGDITSMRITETAHP